MIEIYKLTADDANAFVRNLKSLRPIQEKEIKDLLSEITKTSTSITLFNRDAVNNQDGSTPKKQKSFKLNDQQAQEIQAQSNRNNAIDVDDDTPVLDMP
jgi:hypothetical protein